jgi:hypothetical protein
MHQEAPRDIAIQFIALVLKLATERQLNGPQPFCRIIDPLPVMASKFNKYADACLPHLKALVNNDKLPPGEDTEACLEFLSLWRKNDNGTICVWKTNDKYTNIYVFLLNRTLLDYRAEQIIIKNCIQCGKQATMQCAHCQKVYCSKECVETKQ